ncbi:MAG: hypothetical protein R3B72_47025 [Polyangiaceae bacterium]
MNRLGGLLLYPLALATACADRIDHTAPTEDNPLGLAACEGTVWRNASPGRVLCPGADGCGCDLPAGCCYDSAESKGTCTAANACAGAHVICDGPEDCAAGLVCCVRDDIGASCLPVDDCDLTMDLLCRDDADCPDSITRDTCEPADIPAIASCR